jgi:hypothetical protein
MTRRRKRFAPDYALGKFTFSRRLRFAIKRHPVAGYRIGLAAGIPVPSFYKMIAGMTPISRDDKRVAKLCEVLGISPDLGLVPFDRWGD